MDSTFRRVLIQWGCHGPLYLIMAMINIHCWYLPYSVIHPLKASYTALHKVNHTQENQYTQHDTYVNKLAQRDNDMCTCVNSPYENHYLVWIEHGSWKPVRKRVQKRIGSVEWGSVAVTSVINQVDINTSVKTPYLASYLTQGFYRYDITENTWMDPKALHLRI